MFSVCFCIRVRVHIHRRPAAAMTFASLLSDWCETRKQINWILGWLYGLALWPYPWPWLCSFKVIVSNSHIWGMGRLIDIEQNGCESIIHDHDRYLWVTMVGWVDVTGVTSNVSMPSTYLVMHPFSVKPETFTELSTLHFKDGIH